MFLCCLDNFSYKNVAVLLFYVLGRLRTVRKAERVGNTDGLPEAWS